MATIGIVYFSMTGSTKALAEEIATGIEEAGGKAELRTVPHDLPDEVLESNDQIAESLEAQSDVPHAEVELLPEFDGLVFGSPTRFGASTSQLQKLFDQCGPLWAEGKLVGTPAGFFTGAATMHGGHESTILGMSTFAYHQGMPIVPMGYASGEVGETQTGGSPYGPGQLTPNDGSKTELSEHEVAIARAYGRHFNEVADKLAA